MAALVITGALLLPTTTAQASGGRPERPAVASLVVQRAGIDGAVTFLGGARPLTPPDAGAGADGAGADEGEVAREFVDEHAAEFGADGEGSELVESGTTPTADGGGAVRFQQEVDGVPVVAGQLVVRVDEEGSVLSTAGEALPDTEVDTTPTVPAADALATAVALTSKTDAIDAALLEAAAPELNVFDPRLVGAPGPAAPSLVWRVEVRTAIGDIDRIVFVDAHTGIVAFTYGQVRELGDVKVCDNASIPRASDDDLRCDPALSVVKSNANAGSNTGIADVESAFALATAVKAYYAGLGRNSIDNANMDIISTVRACYATAGYCPLENAFWSGTQMVYGDTYASGDDVVGHELTHGVTQYESDLMYYAESGAINESLSDVFGELFDQSYNPGADSPATKWLMGEDLPPLPGHANGAIRSMSDPPAFGDPDRMTSANYAHTASDEYGVHTNSGVNNKAAFLITDGGTFNGITITGIGPAKAARVYYEAQTALLTPGSDFLDLYYALQQACTNLVSPSGISTADCAQVTKAVTATEMNLDPTVPGGRLRAADCPSGQARLSTLYFSDMEPTSQSGWVGSVGTGSWSFTTASSQSGATSLWGPDTAVLTTTTATMAQASAVTVPSANTYLRFDHSYSFEQTGTYPAYDYWDGGQVQLIVGSAAPVDVAALAGAGAVNGYTGQLEVGSPRAGQSAFVGNSPGYQETRYNIGAAAGQPVRVRFLIATDSLGGSTGWMIDDVEIYTCPGPPGAPTGVVATAGNGSASLTWSAPASDGGSAITGYVITPFANGVAGAAIATGSTATSSTVGSLTTGTSYTFTVAAVNAMGAGAASAASNAVVPQPMTFQAVSPRRVFDTRPGESPDAIRSVPKTPLSPAVPLQVGFASLPGGLTPSTGLGAVSLNVAVTNAPSGGFITVYPCGNRPFVASVNYAAGQTVSNAVIAPVSASGDVCFYASSPADVIVDINGWYPTGAAYTAVGPGRVFDTRPGESPEALRSVPKTPVDPAVPLDVQVTGLAGGITPGSGVGAVSLNVAVTNPSKAGFITVFPCENRKLVASVNYSAGQTVSNAVIAPVSASGHVCFFTSATTDLIVDINGWFPTGDSFHAVGPERVFDTRPGESPNALRSVPKVQVDPATPLQVRLAGLPGGVTPASGVGAVSLNVAVTNPGKAGFITVYPCGQRELVASVNYVAGQTVSNAVVAPVSASGDVCFFASSPTDLIVDINGWFPTAA